MLSEVEPRRVRDKEHLRFVANLPCLFCGRSPSQLHHIRYAQPRALGRKVSDQWVVPLCALHHRALHDHGNEAQWWKQPAHRSNFRGGATVAGDTRRGARRETAGGSDQSPGFELARRGALPHLDGATWWWKKGRNKFPRSRHLSETARIRALAGQSPSVFRSRRSSCSFTSTAKVRSSLRSRWVS